MAHYLPPKFLLGVLDEPINETNKFSVSYINSKIGGKPDLIVPGIQDPRCNICNRPQAFILQLYAPRDLFNHRLLYIYGCINRQCWNNSNSFVVYRCQKLDDSSITKSIEKTRDNTLATDWLENADDWEDENMESEKDNEGNVPASQLQRLRQESAGWDNSAGNTGNKSGSCSSSVSSVQNILGDDFVKLRNQIELPGSWFVSNQARVCNDKLDLLDEQGNNANTGIYHAEAEGPVIENLRKLCLGDAGNGAIEGAVGIDMGPEAFAEIEPLLPSEGTVTVDTPIEPAPELVEALFGTRSNYPLPREVVPTLKSWFLAVVEEPQIECSSVFSDHERELLVHYQRQEGLNINELYNACKSKTDINSTGEIYEKATPIHGNRAFYKFQSRLSIYPEQIIRYSCDPGSYCIPIASMSQDDADPGKCNYCGGERAFELQIMPTIVDSLRIEGLREPAIEFGTVIIYTCKSSCWKDGDTFREEKVVIQCDPDNSLFVLMENQRNVCT